MQVFWKLRSLLAAVLFAITTFAVSTSAIICSFFTNSPKVQRWHIKKWGRLCCRFFGVNVVVKGLEHWPFQEGAVVLFNHTSFIDIFAMSGFLPAVTFGAKKELFKIPIFGAAMRRVGILPIDRARRDQTFKVYEQSTERLLAGEKIALAPEGGRTSTPHEIGPFKAGPFVFALQAGVKLIPVVIVGAYEIFPKGALLPNADRSKRTLYLEVLPSIPVEGQSVDERGELQKRARDLMQTTLNSYYMGVQ